MTESGVRKRLADRRFLFGVTFAAAVLAFLGPLADYDVWWHMRAGRLILESRAVPQTDPFSFTAAGAPWVYHSWLSGVILYLVHQAGGVTALILLRALLLAGTLMLAWGAALRRGVGAGLASVLVLAAALQLKMRALERPFLFSLLLFVVFALVLQGCASSAPPQVARSRRRWLAAEDGFLWGPGGRLLALPVLTVLWANLHAGFVSGMLLIGAYGAGEAVGLAARCGVRALPDALVRGADGARFRAMFIAGVLCLAAAVVTPYGPDVLLYPFWLSHTVKLLQRVQEWQPMPWMLNFAVFWSLLAFAVVIFARSLYFMVVAGRLRAEAAQFATDVLLVGGFGLLAVRSVRHMEWLLLIVPAVLGWHLQSFRRVFLERGERYVERRAYAYVACIVALAVGVWPLITDGLPRPGLAPYKFPVKACDYMAAHGLDYRFYNTYEWGGYLVWRFWPAQRVFIDGRCEVYGDAVMGPAIAVEEGSAGWEQVLARWDVKMFIVRYRKRDSAHLFADGRWRCAYWDDAAIIGIRDGAFGARRPALFDYSLSNPLVFEQSLQRASPAAILREVDAALSRDPACWTAHAFRARCLVRQARADPANRSRLLSEAVQSAREAVRLEPKHYEPWVAAREVAEAVGDAELAKTAARQVARLKPSPEKPK
jgi:hypothetical protein